MLTYDEAVGGEADGALGIETLDGIEKYVSDLTLRRPSGVSHWEQQEAPGTVNTVLRDWRPRLRDQ